MIQFDAASFTKLGLETAGFFKWESYLPSTNIDRFRGLYGPSPEICETVWIELQMSDNDDCHIGDDANPLHLLLGLWFLRAYSTERELAGMFKMSEKAVRKWSGTYAYKISLLLVDMVSD
jgi:hypothetical protein